MATRHDDIAGLFATAPRAVAMMHARRDDFRKTTLKTTTTKTTA